MSPSRSAVDQAGENLRRAIRGQQDLAPADLATVEAVREEYLPIVVYVQTLLKETTNVIRANPTLKEYVRGFSEVGEDAVLSVASRPKTMESILAKLGRESTRLSQMQDIAGGRIILPLPDLQQALLDTFLEGHEGGGLRVIRVTDTRRLGDAHGYRAVHVVVEIEGRPAEVQIRTPLQQSWAQLVEDLDRRFGSDLKHGDGPSEWKGWLVALSAGAAKVEAGEEIEYPEAPDISNTEGE